MKFPNISKKLSVAVLVVLLEFLRANGWLEFDVTIVDSVALTYLGGQSVVDAVLAYKLKK